MNVRNAKLRLPLAILLVLAMVVLAACGSGSQSDGTGDGSGSGTGSGTGSGSQSGTGSGPNQIVGAVSADWKTMDPGYSYEPYGSFVLSVLYDRLVRQVPADGSIVPSLAIDWDVSDDGTEYVFNLRDDVTFVGGNPLTADDVVFSFWRLKNLKGNPSFLAENIANVEAVDTHTVRITLHEPEGAFLTKLTEPPFSVVDSKVVQAQGGTNAENAAETDTAQAWLDQNSAGSGPYVLKKWVLKDELVLERNPDYWGPAPQIDEIVLKEIEDPNTQALQLQKGDIDLAFSLTADQVGMIDGQPGTKLVSGPGFYIVFLLMNQDPAIGGPMADEKVRQAVRAALDYEGMLELFGDGTVTPHSFIQVGFAGALPAGRTRDVEKAKSLLAEAGYPDGFNITLEVPTLTVSGVQLLTVAEKSQQDLAEIGINATLEPGEVGVSLPRYRDGEQGFSLWYWGPDYPDPATQLAFLPGETVGLRARWTADHDPELAELGKQALRESDQDTRIQLLQEIQRRTHDYGPWAVMLQAGRVVGVRDNIEATFHPDYGVELHTLIRR